MIPDCMYDYRPEYPKPLPDGVCVYYCKKCGEIIDEYEYVHENGCCEFCVAIEEEDIDD